jgi:hypothetical protein
MDLSFLKNHKVNKTKVSALPLAASTPISLNDIADIIATNHGVLSPPHPTAVSSKQREFDNTQNSPTAISAELMSYLTNEEVAILTARPEAITNEAQNDIASAESHIKSTGLEPQDRTSSEQSQTPSGSVVALDIQSRPKVMSSPIGTTSQQGLSLVGLGEPLLMRFDAVIKHGDTVQRGNIDDDRHRDSGYLSGDGMGTSSAPTLVDVTLDHSVFVASSSREAQFFVSAATTSSMSHR